eukprot:3951638-Pleurochrysis_carterae.AAC.1
MKQTQEWPAARRLPRLPACRRWREAINALACVEGADEVAPAVGAAIGETAPAWVSGHCEEAFNVLGASPLEGTASGCGEAASDEPLWEGAARVV